MSTPNQVSGLKDASEEVCGIVSSRERSGSIKSVCSLDIASELPFTGKAAMVCGRLVSVIALFGSLGRFSIRGKHPERTESK